MGHKCFLLIGWLLGDVPYRWYFKYFQIGFGSFIDFSLQSTEIKNRPRVMPRNANETYKYVRSCFISSEIFGFAGIFAVHVRMAVSVCHDVIFANGCFPVTISNKLNPNAHISARMPYGCSILPTSSGYYIVKNN